MADSHSSLSSQHCVPCEGGTLPLTRKEFEVYLTELPQWQVINTELAIQREFIFADFKTAIARINQIAEISEKEGHHPDLNLHDYKNLTVTLSTHAIGGLSINDFVLAIKIDALQSA